MSQSRDGRGRKTRISFQLIRNVTSPEEKQNDVQTLIANVPAYELRKLGTEDNLRTYIPEHSPKRRNAVHKAIAWTIENSPDRFINRNSGITIASSKAEIDDKASVITLYDASIINGAQTQGEILRAFEGLDEEGIAEVGAFHVRAEINVDPDHASVVETAIARNSATAVKDISQAGARGHLNDLEKVIRKEFGQGIRKSETDVDVMETLQILQYTRLMMPLSVSGNDTASEMLRPYKNKAQCLEDFSQWYLDKDKDADSKTRYDFVVQMAPTAIREYEYWERHPSWNGHMIWEETKKGGRAVRRDKNKKIVWVAPGIVFPVLKAMSEFVALDKAGRWTFKKPRQFKPEEMIRKAVAQFRAADSNPMSMGRSESAYEALITYPSTIMEVMREFRGS